MSSDARDQALQRLRYGRFSGKGPASRQALRVLGKEREQGWSVNVGEYRPDVIPVAPGFPLHGEAHAIVIAGPTPASADGSTRSGAWCAMKRGSWCGD